MTHRCNNCCEVYLRNPISDKFHNSGRCIGDKTQTTLGS